jgi:hypothetical protein
LEDQPQDRQRISLNAGLNLQQYLWHLCCASSLRTLRFSEEKFDPAGNRKTSLNEAEEFKRKLQRPRDNCSWMLGAEQLIK